MALSEQYLTDELHPIDIVENIAQFNDWDFDRVTDDQIAMAVEGQWLNAVNDQCWAGCFSYWEEQRLMVYKYGLMLAGGNIASAEQIDTMITAAVLSAERYYPAFQLMAWTDRSAKDALQIAMAEAYGRA